MNRMEQLAHQAENLMQELDQEITDFRAWAGIGCAFGCGKCCLKPDIEAAPLEFLPFAIAVHREGKLDEWLESLAQAGDVCVIYDDGQPGVGKCSRYAHRGLICRLFGFAARRNKYGRKELVTCSIIKTEQSEAYAATQSGISEGGRKVPVFTDYYERLRDIDEGLGGRYLPVNSAIRTALEAVATYFQYEGGEGTV